MKSSRLKEDRNIKEHIIKVAGNLFRLKKLENQTNDAAIKGIRNLFRLKKENDAIKDEIIRDIRNLFEHEEENYCKSLRLGNFLSDNDIEFESNGDRN